VAGDCGGRRPGRHRWGGEETDAVQTVGVAVCAPPGVP